MNREIKFRGKSIATGEWVYGNYQAGKGKNPHVISWWTVQQHEGDIWDEIDVVEVDPETVGQYIKIENYEFWEGDIFEFEIGSLYKLNKPLDRGVIALNDYAEWTVGSMLLNRICHRGQVIGNRWDNPELLGGNQ